MFLSASRMGSQPIVVQSGKTCMSIKVAKTQKCSLFNCFSTVKRQKQNANLMTLDNVHYWPKQFFDFASAAN